MEKQLTTFGKRKRTNWYTVSNQYDNTQRLTKYTPPATKSIATQVQAVERDIRSLKKKDEIKNFRFGPSSTGATTTALITPISGMGAGVGSADRIGNRIKMFSFALSGFATNAAASTPTLAVRICVFIDWRNLGVLPLITDIFDSNADYNNNILRSSGPSKMSRFTIIYDEVLLKHADGLNIAGDEFNQQVVWINKFYRRIHHYAYYDSGSVGITAIRKGGLFIITGTNNNSATLQIDTVLKYTDS